MELELHGALFFWKNQKRNFNVSEKSKWKILDVDNIEIYKPVKSQFQILCILAYRKKDKSDEISSFENM
jgi:hypothetical protein